MKNEEIILTEKQKSEFQNAYLIAGYKQLYENGYLNSIQLEELLKMHSGSDNP